MVKFYVGEYFVYERAEGEDGVTRTIYLFHKLDEVFEVESSEADMEAARLRAADKEYVQVNYDSWEKDRIEVGKMLFTDKGI